MMKRFIADHMVRPKGLIDVVVMQCLRNHVQDDFTVFSCTQS